MHELSQKINKQTWKNNFKNKTLCLPPDLLFIFRTFLFILLATAFFMGSGVARSDGAFTTEIYKKISFTTTNPSGSSFWKISFDSRKEAYFHVLNKKIYGEGQEILADGDYVFQVTNPAGNILLSSDPAQCRIVKVANGYITGLRRPFIKNNKLKITNRKNNDACNTQDNPDGAPGSSGQHDKNRDRLYPKELKPRPRAIQLMPFQVAPHTHLSVFRNKYNPWCI